MGITRFTYESILKEYDDLQLQSAHELEARRTQIDLAVPELEGIEQQITSMYISRTIGRLRNSQDISEEDFQTQINQLNTRKKQLLEDAGFSLSDLEPHFVCEKCHDTGYEEDGTMCSCFRDRIIDRLYDFSHIRAVLDKENFNTFEYKYYASDRVVDKQGRTPRDIAEEAVTKSLNFVRNFRNSSENLFICGGTGVGKTFLANCIAREIIEAGYTVIYLPAVRLFDILADSAFDRQQESDISARLIYDCDLLIIDDLGTEMTNSFVQTHLFNVLNERMLKGPGTRLSNYTLMI